MKMNDELEELTELELEILDIVLDDSMKALAKIDAIKEVFEGVLVEEEDEEIETEEV
jgi:hypothetical protein